MMGGTTCRRWLDPRSMAGRYLSSTNNRLGRDPSTSEMLTTGWSRRAREASLMIAVGLVIKDLGSGSGLVGCRTSRDQFIQPLISVGVNYTTMLMTAGNKDRGFRHWRDLDGSADSCLEAETEAYKVWVVDSCWNSGLDVASSIGAGFHIMTRHDSLPQAYASRRRFNVLLRRSIASCLGAKQPETTRRSRNESSGQRRLQSLWTRIRGSSLSAVNLIYCRDPCLRSCSMPFSGLFTSSRSAPATPSSRRFQRCRFSGPCSN